MNHEPWEFLGVPMVLVAAILAWVLAVSQVLP
jgi:hypothetical protein